MSKVLSWDIGLKNLSYCILQENTDSDNISKTRHNHIILDWEVINLYQEEINNCQELTSKNKICNKKTTYCNNNKYYCKTHSPKNDQTFLIKNKKKKNRNPFEYAVRIKNELDKRPKLNDVDIVLLENQPALVNPIMKTVQMIVFSYFAFKNTDTKKILVYNVSASRKEKLPLEDNLWENSQYQQDYLLRIQNITNKYSKRKFLCYYYALYSLENYPEMNNYLLSHSKKDDLTDCFLMCIDWFLHKIS